MTMEKYPTYKHSGIKWVGEIPEHWVVLKLKRCLQLINQKTYPNSTLPYIGMENVESWSGKYVESTIETEGQANIFLKGDILFGKLRPYLAKVYLAEFQGCCSSELLVYRSKNQNKKYLQRLLIAKGFIDLIDASTYGAKMPRANSLFIGNQLLPIPPNLEQQAIVTFLENQTSNIDAYIKLRDQEITALEELKRAEIANVVTKGLNPNVKMKDSGIPWTSKVPAHWEDHKIRYLFNERSQKGFPNEPILCATQSYGVIPQYLYENRVVVVNNGLEGLKLVEVGDFVISLRSFQGGIEYAYYKGIISAAYTILIPSKSLNSNFIKYLFKSYPFIELLKTCVTGIREGQNINYENLRNKYLMLPPTDEQQQIVEYIELRVANIDKFISSLKNEIEQMQEYKKRLISDAVTGKMDVRNVVVKKIDDKPEESVKETEELENSED